MAKLDDQDLKTIKGLMEAAIGEAVERRGLVTKDDIGNLATKDELYGKMDEVKEELKAVREEHATINRLVIER